MFQKAFVKLHDPRRIRLFAGVLSLLLVISWPRFGLSASPVHFGGDESEEELAIVLDNILQDKELKIAISNINKKVKKYPEIIINSGEIMSLGSKWTAAEQKEAPGYALWLLPLNSPYEGFYKAFGNYGYKHVYKTINILKMVPATGQGPMVDDKLKFDAHELYHDLFVIIAMIRVKMEAHRELSLWHDQIIGRVAKSLFPDYDGMTDGTEVLIFNPSRDLEYIESFPTAVPRDKPYLRTDSKMFYHIKLKEQ